MDAGRWHSLWTCNLSASAAVECPLALGQQPELLVICHRYRGKPSDVGVCMFGRVLDQHGMETQGRRMCMRKSMDSFGAAFGGHVSHAGQKPMVFNMFLRKTGAGDEASVRAAVPRVLLPSLTRLPSLSGRTAAQEILPGVSIGSRASPYGHRPHDDDVQKDDLPVCTNATDLFSDEEVKQKATHCHVTGLAKRVFPHLCNIVLCGRKRA